MGKAAINASHSFAVISGTHCKTYRSEYWGEWSLTWTWHYCAEPSIYFSHVYELVNGTIMITGLLEFRTLSYYYAFRQQILFPSSDFCSHAEIHISLGLTIANTSCWWRQDTLWSSHYSGLSVLTSQSVAPRRTRTYILPMNNSRDPQSWHLTCLTCPNHTI